MTGVGAPVAHPVGAVIGGSAAPAWGQVGWKENVLHAFTGGAGGGTPAASVLADARGTLYGIDLCRREHLELPRGCGTVFKLTPPPAGQTNWTATELHTFANDGRDGWAPNAGLVADANGDVYGTTSFGGSRGCFGSGCGTVFKLTPPARGHTAWTEAILHAFTGAEGQFPYAGLVALHGSLYGTTEQGGGGVGCGTVFRLASPAPGHAEWTYTVLHAFIGGRQGDLERGPHR